MSRIFVNIFTDGSCSGNPGPGGWSVVFDKCYWLKECDCNNITHSILIMTGGEEHTTNNRMELMAVLYAMKAINKDIYNGSIATIYSDSSYVINALKSGLLNYWATKSNFTSIRGQTIANSDLWKDIWSIYKNNNSTFVFNKIKGHSHGDIANNMNQIADAAAKEMTKIFKARS